jgi:hypothetical protein
MRKSDRKYQLFNERRVLVEVAEANPTGAHDEVGDSGPAHTRRPVGPNGKVGLLVAAKLVALRARWRALRTVWSAPVPATDDERAGRADEIWNTFATTSRYRKRSRVLGRGDSDECRLRGSGFRCARHNTVAKARHKRVRERRCPCKPPGIPAIELILAFLPVRKMI